MDADLYGAPREDFFAPSLVNAIRENIPDSIRSIMSEPHPGIFTFDMVQQSFCQKMLGEGKTMKAFIDTICNKIPSKTVALLAPRGRGKSAALGLAVAGAIAIGSLVFQLLSSHWPRIQNIRMTVFK